MSAEIGQRVSDLLPQGRTQREIASDVGMTPDAFSRALSGQRGFAAIELARIADLLGADLHFLITGEPDPNRVLAAARHTFDHETRSHQLPAVEEDIPHLDVVLLAYEQVQGTLPSSEVPDTLDAARAALGDHFVRPFADRLEMLGIDVVRLTELTSAYSFFVGDRAVIALKATGNWFWENWSLAHELGHLVQYSAAVRAGEVPDRFSDEPEANAFAAELLLPADWAAGIDWTGVSEQELAAMVWDLGVSTDALSKRLASLHLPSTAQLAAWAAQPTQRLLRRFWTPTEDGDPITQRMDAAATRRFPLALQDAHLSQIAKGSVRKDTLAWMLGVDADALEVDEPISESTLSSDELSAVLGL
ncbi:ImmA/IrrE family metallo-endopeptidase [Leifsonia xyli]|uniref:ImmA/IrrE family metallo-endopeptidase n=1 Tax=Leifsonia xyli TaxID=1575 RepID=UPI003D67E03D